MTDADRRTETRRAIEAIVMAATTPVEPTELAQLIEVPVDEIESVAGALASEYAADSRGFTIARVAGGYRYQTAEDLAVYVERFVLEGRHARLSKASMETLAIVAYKQPISRGQIAAIRGVNVDATMKTLLARGYVEEVGQDPGPGNATLFGTTSLFLERLGLDEISDLPALADFVPDASVVESLERGLRLSSVSTAGEASDAPGVASTDG